MFDLPAGENIALLGGKKWVWSGVDSHPRGPSGVKKGIALLLRTYVALDCGQDIAASVVERVGANCTSRGWHHKAL